jgi:hypothetical protein
VALGAGGREEEEEEEEEEESEEKHHHPQEVKLEGRAELEQAKEERYVSGDVSSSSSSSSLEDVVGAHQNRQWAERDSKGYRASRRS